MQFQVTDEQNRKDWEKVLGQEVGRVVYLTHDAYMDHRLQIEELQAKAGSRKAVIIEH